MTLASSIIKRAYRKTNLIPLVGTPNTNQSTEALEMLNSLILSCIGNEAGDELLPLNFGGGFSEHDQSEVCDQWVPVNTRLVLNLTAADTVELDPYPYDGQRLAIIDAGNTLDTYSLTISPNGRKIEGSASNLVLSTEGLERQWMYRADTGNWVKITSLATSDEMPFPIEFDMYFVISLALQLNPQYGQQLTAEDSVTLNRSRSQLRARYRNRKGDQLPDFGVTDPRDLYSHSDFFNFGYLPFWGRRY
jgi:hypothetical protein